MFLAFSNPTKTNREVGERSAVKKNSTTETAKLVFPGEVKY